MTRRTRREEPLCRHIDGLIEELRRHVPQALGQEFEAQSIHKSRVATRRIKAALDLLSPLLDARRTRPLYRTGRRLRRRLGPMRDLDVMLGHVRELAQRRREPDAALQWIESRLSARRLKRRRKASRIDHEKLLAKLGAWWDVRASINQSQAAIDPILEESVRMQLDAFAQRAVNLDAHDPHELRIAGKALRYTLELAKAHGKRLPAMVLRSFKRMQDALGLWHDYVVLGQTILKQSLRADLALHDARLQQKLLELSRDVFARAKRELVRFSKLWEQKGELLTGTIHAAFARVPESPAVQSVEQPHEPTESQTDRGPFGSDETARPGDDRSVSAPAA